MPFGRNVIFQLFAIAAHPDLRASFCKYRKSRDSLKIFNFFAFCQTYPLVCYFRKHKKQQQNIVFFNIRGQFENRYFGMLQLFKIE